MKLYFLPGACSLASHIALREAGSVFEIDKIDKKTRTTSGGADFLAINPKGYVPALQLDDGEVLTEGAAVLQYIADRNPHAKLAPEAGTLERTRLQEHLNYIGSELHKAFSPFFSPNPLEGEARAAAEANVGRKFAYIESILSDGREYLVGETFSVADAYLFVVASWTRPCRIDLSPWPGIEAFVQRVAARDATREAMKAEGLLG